MGHLRQTLHNSDFTATGKKRKNIVDWFEANSSVLNPVLEEIRTAVMKEKRKPTQTTYWKSHPLRKAIDTLRIENALEHLGIPHEMGKCSLTGSPVGSVAYSISAGRRERTGRTGPTVQEHMGQE